MTKFVLCVLFHNKKLGDKDSAAPWPGCPGGKSAGPIRQDCAFDPWSGHVRESANELWPHGSVGWSVVLWAKGLPV